MRALRLVDGWPVATAAVAVLTRDGGCVGERGPTARVLPLASVTKPLTAYAVLLAAEEGALGLDDPAGPPGATVRHLLAHAGGLASDSGERAAPVGARRVYSNHGYALLGALVAARTGVAFADYLRDGVLAPLGMTATTLAGSPAWGARSSVADLARFAAELLAPRLLAPATLAEATTVAFPGLAGVLPGFGRQDRNDWGLGFELRDAKTPHWTGGANSAATFGHFGRSGTFLWVDPRAGVACVCLTDREFGRWAVTAWPELSDAVLAELGPGLPAAGPAGAAAGG